MANESAARRYAQAAFDLAAETGDFADWTSALGRIAHFMTEGDAGPALQNARVPEDVKHQLVDAGLGDLPRLPLNLAHLLVSKGRVSLAAELADQFTWLVEDKEGITRARATTAVELSDADRAILVQRLEEATGRQVILEAGVDSSILGGVVIQIGDRLIDGSTRARLKALRGSLAGAVK